MQKHLMRQKNYCISLNSQSIQPVVGLARDLNPNRSATSLAHTICDSIDFTL